MPTITALLHTENDALRLGRCLETLYSCDRILVVDHGSRDSTVHLAREYGARIAAVAPGANSGDYVRSADLGWILCLDPHESVSESLAASLYEWKSSACSASSAPSFSVFLREETADGWLQVPEAQTRLVPAGWNRWDERLPVSDPSALVLEGELLRFAFP
jgi:cellulose synthase/poly-beta-1,6-N-acetylglucosamine synthase-like glycosyltransferase